MSSNQFKDEFDFETRKHETHKIREKFPQKFPVVVQVSPRDKILKDIDKRKFLVPYDMKFSDFGNIIRKRMSDINEIQSIFFYVGTGKILDLHANMSVIYESYKDEDGYLYVFYHGENTFG